MGKKLKKTMVIGGAAAAAYGFLPSQLGKLCHRLQKQAVRSVEALEGPDKILYLTFDDGPHPVCTAKLLDLLHQYNVKATFFVVGKFAEENPGLVVRMKEEGHVIGLHSYAHRSAMIQWAGSVKSDMDRCIRVLQDLGTVSYTHLDVYKRQPYSSTRTAYKLRIRMGQVLLRRQYKISLQQTGRKAWRQVYTGISVSYTHLDVYKRQVIPRAVQ